MEFYWNRMKDKQRIVVKVGSSTLTNKDTGNLNYEKLEELVKALSDLKNKGKDVILVSSGAVAVGREILKIGIRPKTMAEKQACAAIGQCALMGSYHNLFAKYNMIVSQVLMTKYSIDEEKSYNNIKATFDELLKYNAIPIVNENDTVATDEIEFGENDTLAAIVAGITKADLLIMLTDTNGLYTDDPFINRNARFIDTVTEKRDHLYTFAKRTSDSDVGTGGMYTKINAANIVNHMGIDMIITNGKKPEIINKIIEGEKYGTLFVSGEENRDNVRNYLIKSVNQCKRQCNISYKRNIMKKMNV